MWLIDKTGQLKTYTSNGEIALVDMPAATRADWTISVTRMPDETMWVSSATSVSVHNPDSGHWQVYDSIQTGLQGPIVELERAPDGTVWGLQTHTFEEPIWRSWGVSALQPTADGDWMNINMRQLTGLEAPTTPDALATDGYGRLWFIAESCYLSKRYIGILNPDGTLVELVTIGELINEPYGILPDGAGGVFLYYGKEEPLRRWMPASQKQ